MSRSRSAVPAIICCVTASLGVTSAAASGSTPGPARPSTSASANCHLATVFDARRFPHHLRRPNPWLSLVPGTFTVLRGTVREDDGSLHPHTIVSAVSGVTKRLDGVRTRVVFERDFEDGALQESELAFAAQDRRGNVWNIGEYPEEYERGRLAGAPSTWIAGLAGARPGLGLPARPRVGTPAYLQGSAPRVGFRDCAKVAAKGRKVCVPARCFRRTLTIDEWSPLDRAGGHQVKFYAVRVGAIRVAAPNGTNPEVLHLTSHGRLRPCAIRRIDAAVLRQDRRGYRVRPHLYGRTPLAHRGAV